MVIDKISLIQPRHIYAPHPKNKKLGHIYMPTSLLTVASLFIENGVKVEIFDENITQAPEASSNIVGINLLGPPYINMALEFEKRLSGVFPKDDFFLLLGGQVISGLTNNQFRKLFGKNTYNGNNFEDDRFYPKGFGIPLIQGALSLIKSYEKISDELLGLYLNNEFCLFVSQGCKYSCTFCSADRSGFNTISNKFEKQVERYRELEVIFSDLEFLIKKALRLRINCLKLYLSNLDLFQTPTKLHDFGIGVVRLREKYNNFSISMRGLSTTKSFLNVHRKHPETIRVLKMAGLKQVGFGVDGASADVFKKVRKPQTEQDCIDAITISKSYYDITPEILMVFGHNNAESEHTLKLAHEFCISMSNLLGALPRPHVAKDIVPGNDGWFSKKNELIVNKYLENPLLFQNLDFTALPSYVTHPDEGFRDLVIKYFKKVCNIKGSLTQFVKPYDLKASVEEMAKIEDFNRGKYDI